MGAHDSGVAVGIRREPFDRWRSIENLTRAFKQFWYLGAELRRNERAVRCFGHGLEQVHLVTGSEALGGWGGGRSVGCWRSVGGAAGDRWWRVS